MKEVPGLGRKRGYNPTCSFSYYLSLLSADRHIRVLEMTGHCLLLPCSVYQDTQGPIPVIILSELRQVTWSSVPVPFWLALLLKFFTTNQIRTSGPQW